MYWGLFDTQDTTIQDGRFIIEVYLTRAFHDHKLTSGWCYIVYDTARRNWLGGDYCIGSGRSTYRDDAIAQARQCYQMSLLYS